MKDLPEYVKQSIIYVVVAATYYLSFFAMIDTSSGFIMLLAVIPAVVFVGSLVHAKMFGFTWYSAIIVGLLWIGVIWLTMGKGSPFNESAYPYAYIYGAVSFVGLLAGFIWRRLQARKK